MTAAGAAASGAAGPQPAAPAATGQAEAGQAGTGQAGTGPSPQPGAMLPGLHGLRAMAALMVVLFHVHAIPQLPLPDWLGWVRWQFSLGVHLFFVLSAFSLAWANPGAAQRPGPYFVKRLFRIGPLFWAMQGYVVLRAGWPGPDQAILDLTFAFNLVPGLHHSRVPAGWTIGTEMVFYAVLPLLLGLRSLRAMLTAAVLATLVSFAARRGLAAAMPGSDYPLIAFVSNAAVFMAGLLAFRLFERVREGPAAGRAAALAAACALGLLGLLLLSPLGARLSRPGNPDILAFGVAFAGLCLWQALRPSRLLRARAAVWVGERSYSLYLLHTPLILALRPAYAAIGGATDSAALGFLGCVAATVPPLLLAALGYRWVERPGMALGRRVLRAWEARQDADCLADRVRMRERRAPGQPAR